MLTFPLLITTNWNDTFHLVDEGENEIEKYKIIAIKMRKKIVLFCCHIRAIRYIRC